MTARSWLRCASMSTVRRSWDAGWRWVTWSGRGRFPRVSVCLASRPFTTSAVPSRRFRLRSTGGPAVGAACGTGPTCGAGPNAADALASTAPCFRSRSTAAAGSTSTTSSALSRSSIASAGATCSGSTRPVPRTRPSLRRSSAAPSTCGASACGHGPRCGAGPSARAAGSPSSWGARRRPSYRRGSSDSVGGFCSGAPAPAGEHTQPFLAAFASLPGRKFRRLRPAGGPFSAVIPLRPPAVGTMLCVARQRGGA